MNTCSLILAALPLLPAFQQGDSRPTPTAPPQRVDLPDEGVTVPLHPERRLPAVEVFIGDAGPYLFIVEWAGNVLTLSEEVSQQAGLDVLGETPHGNAMVAVPSLSVGDAFFEGLVADVAPFFADTDHDGALGLNVFRSIVGTLDFPNKQLHLSTTALPEPAKDPRVVAYSPGPGGSPRVPIKLGGKPFQAVLDTAAESALIIEESFLDQLELAGELRPGGRIMTPMMGVLETREGRVAGELVVGAAREPTPLAVFHRMREPEILLGGGFLRDYSLTLDQRNRRLRLLPKAKAAAPSER